MSFKLKIKVNNCVECPYYSRWHSPIRELDACSKMPNASWYSLGVTLFNPSKEIHVNCPFNKPKKKKP